MNPRINKLFDIILILTCLTFLGIGMLFIGPYFLPVPEKAANRCKPMDYDLIADQVLLEKMTFIQKRHKTDVKFTDLPNLKKRIEAQLTQPVEMAISPHQFIIKLPECHTTVTYTWLHNQPLSLQYQSLQNQKITTKTVALKSHVQSRAAR